MAEFGAHLTSTASNEEGRPSIFDVLADEDLVSTLRPAVKHGLQILAQRNPVRYGRLYVLSDEVYAVLQLLLEHYHLKHYGASFSENFYGMKRMPISSKEDSEDGDRKTYAFTPKKFDLPLDTHIKSLVCVVLVPYLKAKCNDFYEELASDRGNPAQQGVRGRLCRAFVSFYPYLHATWEAAVLLCHLAYILNRLRFHSPLLKLAGVYLEYLNADDWAAHNGATFGSLQLKNKPLWKKLLLLCNHSLWTISRVLSSSLSIGMFFLRFLELWYSSDKRSSSLTSLSNPPAPQTKQYSTLPKLNSICPLCQKMRTNDTALSITGYVFCYPCIYLFVRDHGQCPITGYPATTKHLVKIYLPT